MEQENFKLYKSFNRSIEAEQFADFLDINGIENSLETIANVFDTSISGKAAIPNFLIKIDSKDFEKVNELLIAEAKNISKEDLEAHHLNLLENQELKEIFFKPDEWATEDVEIARQILYNRGITINEDEIKQLKQKRLAIINEGKKGSNLFILLTFSAIVLGLFSYIILIPGGIGMAYYYAYGKSTDINGNVYKSYDTSTQEKGKIALALGILVLIVEFIVLLSIGKL